MISSRPKASLGLNLFVWFGHCRCEGSFKAFRPNERCPAPSPKNCQLLNTSKESYSEAGICERDGHDGARKATTDNHLQARILLLNQDHRDAASKNNPGLLYNPTIFLCVSHNNLAIMFRDTR